MMAKVLLWCVVAGAAVCAAGQDQQATPDKHGKKEKDANQVNDIVYLNAKEERTTCVVPFGKTVESEPSSTQPRPLKPPPECKDIDSGQRFLVQGRRAQFRVTNRKFFTDYSINIDGVTQLKQIAIQDLEEAANLQTPISSAVSGAPKGAAPKGLSTAGQLALRTAQDILGELLDQGKAANPPSELESDALVVERERRKVETEFAALNQTWELIYGVANSTRSCQASLGAPNLSSALACLRSLNDKEHEGVWLGNGPFWNEDKFRELTVEIGDAITLVTTLSGALQQSSVAMSNQLSALDGDLAQWKADLNTLRGNVEAARDAISAYNTLSEDSGRGNVLRPLRRAQIKQRLMQDLNAGAAGAKPTLDDAELNQLVEDYLSHPGSLGKSVTDAQKLQLDREIHSIAARQTAPATVVGDVVQFYIDHFLDIAASQTGGANAALEASQIHLGVDLPTMIDQINAKQSQVLARANEIYDHSAVPEPLDKMVDLSKNSGNLLVYYTVRRVDVFPRYTVPVVTLQGGNPPVVPVPPPATTTTVAMTTPATSTAAGQDMSVGTVVAHGSLQVHDFYRATVVAAFTFSTIKDVTVESKSITSGQANDGTPCSTTSPCSQPFLDKGSPIPSVVIGVNYYLSKLGHDTFPGAHNRLLQKLGIFGGLSADRLNSYFLGVGYEPSEAVQLTSGFNVVSQDAISGAYSPSQVYAGSPSFGGRSTWSHGAYFGAGFNLSIFRKIFGSVTGLGTKASGAGN